MEKICLTLCTAPDQNTAKTIADALVKEKLAACVSLLPQVLSVYRWQGKVEEARETAMMIKTTESSFSALLARIKELHPYDVPEIIALPVTDGLPAYLQWVAEETKR